MQVNTLQPSALAARTRFAAAAAGSDHEAVEAQARKWVAQTFFGTLLKQMRNSPFKSELFGGGKGAEAFGPLYDQHLVDRIARGADRRLVAAVTRRIEGRKAYERNRPGAVSATQPSGGARRTDQP